jgi:hypothetical protein
MAYYATERCLKTFFANTVQYVANFKSNQGTAVRPTPVQRRNVILEIKVYNLDFGAIGLSNFEVILDLE